MSAPDSSPVGRGARLRQVLHHLLHVSSRNELEKKQDCSEFQDGDVRVLHSHGALLSMGPQATVWDVLNSPPSLLITILLFCSLLFFYFHIPS